MPLDIHPLMKQLSSHRPPHCRTSVSALALAAATLCATTAQAQTASSAPAVAPTATTTNNDTVVAQVQSVEIKGQGLRQAGTPYSTTVLDAERIRDAAVSQPEQLLRAVPGVEVRGYHLGGVVNVITIRGFSGGAHGGDLGMVIDGVPLNEAMSHSDGYADLNVIVPLEIGRFEVYRGPVSALYGNFNRGGLIAIESRRGGEYVQADVSAGSFSTFDAQGAVGIKLGSSALNAAAQAFRTGDYRPDSHFTRSTASARWSMPIGAGELSLAGRVHKGDWKSAAYLLKSQFESGDPYGKDARVDNDGGSKNFGTLRADYNWLIAEQIKLLTFAYGTTQDYTRFFTRPLNASTWSQREETYDRGVFGTGFSLNGRNDIAGLRLDWVAGAELYRERTDYLFFEGTKSRVRVTPASYDRRYEFDSKSAYTELTATIAPWLRPTLGLRYDRFDGNCTKSGAETGSDPCSKLNELSRTTPKFGLRSTLAEGLDLRASIAEGFALPPGVAKYATGGAALKPTVLKQTELDVGYRNAFIRADVAGFIVKANNEVRTVSPGVYENFGRTERKGVEYQFAWTPREDIEAVLTGNRTKTRVVENINPVLVGKQITGVPANSNGLAVSWRPESGVGASAELRHVGNSAVDAPNTVLYGAFTTLDLGLQYQTRWDKSRVRAYAKLQNATNRVYASNAFVIGGLNLVAPDAPRSLQVGAQIDF